MTFHFMPGLWMDELGAGDHRNDPDTRGRGGGVPRRGAARDRGEVSEAALLAPHDALGRVKEILATLVGFPTISSEGNLDCIAYAHSLLAPLGARLEVIPDATGKKANLFATIGPDVDGGVILSGHVDVVPVAGQEWSYEPFRLTEAMGRLYGRGTCDMKGFVACALALAPAFAAAPLARPVHLAFTHDEEVGCLGAPRLIAAIKAHGRTPAACIVGEPTSMGLVEGHKGCFEYTTHFEGLEGHGSRPDLCVNAVVYAARYVAELMAIERALRDRAPAWSRFDPPWTTLSIGRFAGGIAHNVIPNRCSVDWEFRPVSPEDPDYVWQRLLDLTETVLLPEMRAIHPEASILTEIVGEVAGLAPEPASPAVALAARLTGRNATGLVPFGTEAGLFQAAGIPTVVCGPGDIAMAHRPDEFIAEEDLAACLAALARLPQELAV
jgi:acetylornithine deacetylase